MERVIEGGEGCGEGDGRCGALVRVDGTRRLGAAIEWKVLAVRAGRCAAAEIHRQRHLVLRVDEPRQRRAVRVLAKVPGGEPAELALSDQIAGFRHSRVAEVGGVGAPRAQDRAWGVVCAPGGPVREATSGPGTAVDAGNQGGFRESRT